jgi:serine/threonine protein kinase
VQQLGELLGRGAFGRVYKGLNFQTGEVVAVKQTRKTDLEPSQLPAVMVRL